MGKPKAIEPVIAVGEAGLGQMDWILCSHPASFPLSSRAFLQLKGGTVNYISQSSLGACFWVRVGHTLGCDLEMSREEEVGQCMDSPNA